MNLNKIVKRGGSLVLILKKDIRCKYDLHEGDYISITTSPDEFLCKKVKDIKL